jgi:hypothetical protein
MIDAMVLDEVMIWIYHRLFLSAVIICVQDRNYTL